MNPKHPKTKYVLAAGIGLLGAILAYWFWNSQNSALPLSFDGKSEALQQTIMVPTLDTPIPEGKSAIWCVSFQIAWNRLRSLAGGEALQVEGAEAVAKRLNQAEESEADLNDDQFYAAGGLARDGIAEKINKAMATKFPGVKVLEMNDRNELIAIAYAYLQAEIKLTRFYLENREPFNFESSQQKSSPVSAFGVHEYVEKTKDIREQIEVLFADKPRPFDAPQEYALDLCRDSAPNQVVVAVLPKRQTLKDMLHDLEEKMSAFQPEPEYRAFRSVDGLLVPNIHWRIQHHFQELEKKAFANPSLAGTYLDPAIQETTFKLDRSGVFLSSQSEIAPKGGPRHFHFNRPFLLYMKKRGAKHPFFVMWVDNAELLIKK